MSKNDEFPSTYNVTKLFRRSRASLKKRRKLLSVDKKEKKGLPFNACVANGGWVVKDLGTETNTPNPGQWNIP